MSLDFGKSFTFLSDDPDWLKKLAIGGGLILAFLVSFITILGWIPIGLSAGRRDPGAHPGKALGGALSRRITLSRRTARRRRTRRARISHAGSQMTPA